MFVKRKPVNRNQIKVIKPYKWNGMWVFDDPRMELDKEALVAGMPEMIEMATERAGIANAQDGFLALFSKDPFPEADVHLKWVRKEMGGDIYFWPESGLEGWLCPALLRYFNEAPADLYLAVKPVGNP